MKKLTMADINTWKPPEPEDTRPLDVQRAEAEAELTKAYGELNAAYDQQIAAYDRMEREHNKVIEEIRHTSPGLYQRIKKNQAERDAQRQAEEEEK
jgi:hypothetical protein